MNVGEDGMYCFFDPNTEKVCVYPLTDSERSAMVTEHGSVSALIESEKVLPHQINLFRKQVPYAR